MRGNPSSIHVIEVDVAIPRFSSFHKLPDTTGPPPPESTVSFYLHETTARLMEWIQASFILASPVKVHARSLSYRGGCGVS